MFSLRLRVYAVVGLWLAGVAGGAAWLLRYESAAGREAVAPATWPADSALRRGERFTLLLFAHPRCVCTLASLDELEWLLSRGQDRAEACVVLVVPPGAPENWEQGAIAKRAAAIPGVRVWTDTGGLEAQRFGARTSGQVLLYDAGGSLTFQGGLTPSRGQRGASPGRECLLHILCSRRNRAEAASPVFGCPLLDPSPCDAGGPACQR